MKIAFLQDFFETEIIGGAEQNDAVLLDYLSSIEGLHVVPVHTYMVDHVAQCYDFFIVSNFVRLSPAAKQYITHLGNYLIYEHDHKYVQNRNPAAFSNFIAPKEKIINKKFYANARKVFVLSNMCKTVIENNLEIDNVHNIGCSLWSEQKLEILSGASNISKIHKYGILNSTNPVKGTEEAAAFCARNSIEPFLVGSPDYAQFTSQLSACENFIFMPQVLETFSRVCAEAKMLNCKVTTMPKMIGFFSEEYSSLSGEQLMDRIRLQMDSALVEFRNTIGDSK